LISHPSDTIDGHPGEVTGKSLPQPHDNLVSRSAHRSTLRSAITAAFPFAFLSANRQYRSIIGSYMPGERRTRGRRHAKVGTSLARRRDHAMGRRGHSPSSFPLRNPRGGDRLRMGRGQMCRGGLKSPAG
jgi:hypothetical protein